MRNYESNLSKVQFLPHRKPSPTAMTNVSALFKHEFPFFLRWYTKPITY